MIDDIEKYMVNKEDYCKMQQFLGYDMVFGDISLGIGSVKTKIHTNIVSIIKR